METDMEYKPLPIGTDDFKELIEKDYYYVDKTLWIKELIDRKTKAGLFTRPRRFGKTLNLSMLRYFFEDTEMCIRDSSYAVQPPDGADAPSVLRASDPGFRKYF